VRVYTIYDHPRDYPQGFVVREWAIIDGATDPVPRTAWYADSLASARLLVPDGHANIGREPGDDPYIVETWV
jgi:hypothetical protein